MENIEIQIVRLETAVLNLEKATKNIERLSIDVAVLKSQNKSRTIKEFIHYTATLIAVLLGVKSNV